MKNLPPAPFRIFLPQGNPLSEISFSFPVFQIIQDQTQQTDCQTMGRDRAKAFQWLTSSQAPIPVLELFLLLLGDLSKISISLEAMK